jgi:hypothetical protein
VVQVTQSDWLRFNRLIRRRSVLSNDEPVLKLEIRSNSQAGQESFVLNATNFKKSGYYVEIGAFHSKILSNTYILESVYEWSGVSFEISKNFTEEFKEVRLNPVFNVDATKCDYKQILNSAGAPKVIDYLQVDIEPARNTFKALRRILETEYRFLVITFEHDLYDSTKNLLYKLFSYRILKKRGFRRVASNVCSDSYPFEDWYIHRSVPTNFKTLPSNCSWREFFYEE